MVERMMSKWIAAGSLAIASVFLTDGATCSQTTKAERKGVLVYPSIAIAVNKSIVVRLPRRAVRVVVTQPEIAEAVVITPDQLLINGKVVGSTSLVVWTEGSTDRKE